jgi:hypothetical protein
LFREALIYRVTVEMICKVQESHACILYPAQVRVGAHTHAHTHTFGQPVRSLGHISGPQALRPRQHAAISPCTRHSSQKAINDIPLQQHSWREAIVALHSGCLGLPVASGLQQGLETVAGQQIRGFVDNGRQQAHVFVGVARGGMCMCVWSCTWVGVWVWACRSAGVLIVRDDDSPFGIHTCIHTARTQSFSPFISTLDSHTQIKGSTF